MYSRMPEIKVVVSAGKIYSFPSPVGLRPFAVRFRLVHKIVVLWSLKILHKGKVTAYIAKLMPSSGVKATFIVCWISYYLNKASSKVPAEKGIHALCCGVCGMILAFLYCLMWEFLNFAGQHQNIFPSPSCISLLPCCFCGCMWFDTWH